LGKIIFGVEDGTEGVCPRPVLKLLARRGPEEKYAFLACCYEQLVGRWRKGGGGWDLNEGDRREGKGLVGGRGKRPDRTIFHDNQNHPFGRVE